MANDTTAAMAGGNRLRWARRLVALALLVPLGAVVLVGGDTWLRSADQDRAAIQWMQDLDLTTPAFWPAGTPQRHPETMTPAVDLRLTPFFGVPVGLSDPPLVVCGQGEGLR